MLKKDYRFFLRIIRGLLNLVVFFPVIVFSLSLFVWIDKYLMAKLLGMIILVIIVPLVNIIVEISIMSVRKAYIKSSILIVVFNIIMLIVNYLVGGFIGMMF